MHSQISINTPVFFFIKNSQVLSTLLIQKVLFGHEAFDQVEQLVHRMSAATARGAIISL